MPRFLILQRSDPTPRQATRDTAAPGEPGPSMWAAFESWLEANQASIVDLGGKLEATGRFARSSGVTDGPFAEAREVVGGYMVLAAESYDQAVEIASGCPGVIRDGSSIEVRLIAGS